MSLGLGCSRGCISFFSLFHPQELFQILFKFSNLDIICSVCWSRSVGGFRLLLRFRWLSVFRDSLIISQPDVRWFHHVSLGALVFPCVSTCFYFPFAYASTWKTTTCLGVLVFSAWTRQSGVRKKHGGMWMTVLEEPWIIWGRSNRWRNDWFFNRTSHGVQPQLLEDLDVRGFCANEKMKNEIAKKWPEGFESRCLQGDIGLECIIVAWFVGPWDLSKASVSQSALQFSNPRWWEWVIFLVRTTWLPLRTFFFWDETELFVWRWKNRRNGRTQSRPVAGVRGKATTNYWQLSFFKLGRRVLRA